MPPPAATAGTSCVSETTTLPHPALNSCGSQSSAHDHLVLSGSGGACRLPGESLAPAFCAKLAVSDLQENPDPTLAEGSGLAKSGT